MDILEEVNHVIENMETKENNNRAVRLVFESTILVELSRQYDRYIANRQLDQARNCLQHISHLVSAMLFL